MTLTAALFLFTFASYALAQAEVGRSCSVKYTGLPGTCKLGADCPSAIKQANQGIVPTICGFDINSVPIVCCEGQAQASENSFLEFPSNQEGFVFQDDNTDVATSESKCLEYSKLVSEQLSILSLIAGAVPTNINITKCDKDGLPLIVGGAPAALGEFPFMAAIGFRNGDETLWNCGGTLISEQYVMTAGHCANSRDYGPPALIRLGDLDLKSTNDGANPIDIQIDSIVKHPSYKSNLKYNDIALIKMRRKVDFTKTIRPACLWNHNDVRKKGALASGWGRIEDGGDTSDKLLKVGLNVLPKSACEKTYHASRSLPQGIIDSMLCAGELKGGKDTCQGDSGGPLFITKENNQCVYYVIGVTSFGKVCGAPNIPGIYTRVSSFIPWIEKTVWT